MLNHIEGDRSFDREIGFLYRFVTSEIRSLPIRNPGFCSNCKVSLSCPLVLLSLLNGALNTPLFQQSAIETSKRRMALNKIFEKELYHMIKGIDNQVLNSTSKCFQIPGWGTTFAGRNVQLAEKHFGEGLPSMDTMVSAVLYLKYMSCEILMNIFETLLKPTTSSTNSLQHKTLLYQRKHNLKDVECNCETTTDLQLLANTFTGLASVSFPKITYFTCTAFATNFYLNIGNYKLALDVSTNAINLFKPIRAIEVYHYIVPVLMVDDWSAVFDKQIQTILGFYTLVKHHLKMKTFVLDRICPLLFLHYLQVQCCWQSRDIKFNDLSGYIDKFKQHHTSCFLEKYCRLNRSQILTCALRLSGISASQLR